MFARKRDVENVYFATANMVEDIYNETDDLWEAVSELSALVEFLVEKQQRATSKGPSGSTKPQTSKGKTASKTNSKATKKVANGSRTKRA